MLNLLFYMVVCAVGILIGGTSVVLKVPVNAATEAFAVCSTNGDLDKIEVKSGQARAVCTNGARFELKEK